jgi:hypothetical protein
VREGGREGGREEGGVSDDVAGRRSKQLLRSSYCTSPRLRMHASPFLCILPREAQINVG